MKLINNKFLSNFAFKFGSILSKLRKIGVGVVTLFGSILSKLRKIEVGVITVFFGFPFVFLAFLKVVLWLSFKITEPFQFYFAFFLEYLIFLFFFNILFILFFLIDVYFHSRLGFSSFLGFPFEKNKEIYAVFGLKEEEIKERAKLLKPLDILVFSIASMFMLFFFASCSCGSLLFCRRVS